MQCSKTHSISRSEPYVKHRTLEIQQFPTLRNPTIQADSFMKKMGQNYIYVATQHKKLDLGHLQRSKLAQNEALNWPMHSQLFQWVLHPSKASTSTKMSLKWRRWNKVSFSSLQFMQVEGERNYISSLHLNKDQSPKNRFYINQVSHRDPYRVTS